MTTTKNETAQTAANSSKRRHSLTEDGKVIHLSVSQLNDYAQCSESWYLKKIARVPQAPTAWLPHGVAAHSAIEAWENSDRQMPEGDVLDVALTAYREHANELVEQYPDEVAWLTGTPRIKGFEDLTRREEILKFQVLQYMAQAIEEQDYWRVVESERGFEITLGGVKVVGYCDQLLQDADGTYTVADLKSGTKTPAAPIQLATYSLALGRDLGIEIPQGEWVQLGRPATPRGKEKPIKRTMIEFAREPGAQVEALERFFYAVKQGIESRSFVPNAGDHCRVCPVRQFCSGVGHLESSQQYPRPVPVNIGPSPWDQS